MVQNIGSLGSHDAFHRIFHSPSSLAAWKLYAVITGSQKELVDTKRGHYASCFSNHGTFWSTLYGDEWWRGLGGGVLCRWVGVRGVVQAFMVPREMSTICKQFVSQQSLKAGSTCISVCLYIFLWIPSLLLTVLATLLQTLSFLENVWLTICILTNYDEYSEIRGTVFLTYFTCLLSFFWCLYWGLAGWQHCLFGCLWRLVGGKCLVQSPWEVDPLMAINLEQADFWVETCCISGFVSHILTRCFGFCFGQNSLAWLRQKSKYLGSVYIPMTPWCGI